MKEHLDLIVVGAGPSGLACAIEAKKRKLKFWVLEKGCVVHSIYRYPTNMTFSPRLICSRSVTFP